MSTPHPFIELVDYGQIAKAVRHGVDWLLTATNGGKDFAPSPIGFYFAKLWYHERLYPLVFTVGALERVIRPVR